MKSFGILAAFLSVSQAFHGGSVHAAAENQLTFPQDASLVFEGKSPLSGAPCKVRVRTQPDGNIAYLSMEGAFSGRAFTLPRGLAPAAYGYDGTVEFFKGISSGEFYLDRHIFRPGFTLSWNSGEMPPHTREMGFFGAQIEDMDRIVYSENSLLSRLKGECKNLSVTVLRPHAP